MTSTTPRGYEYPEYADTQNFPTQMQALAEDVDNDVYNNLYLPITLAQDEPSVRVVQNGAQVVAQNVNVTLTYDTEFYDNDSMANLGVNNTQVTVNTPGIYLISGAIRVSPSGSAGGAVALTLMSSGALIANPVGVSRALDNDKITAISYTTLHYVPTVPETFTQFARHNHSVGLSMTGAQMTFTRIA